MDQAALGDFSSKTLIFPARLQSWGQAPGRRWPSNSAAWCLFFRGRNYETIFDDVLVRDEGWHRDISVLLWFDEIRAPTKYPTTLSSPVIDLGWKRSFGINTEIWGRYKGRSFDLIIFHWFSGLWWQEPWNFLTFHSVGNFIIPTDAHIFQRGRSTTNQFLFTIDAHAAAACHLVHYPAHRLGFNEPSSPHRLPFCGLNHRFFCG